MYGVKFKIKSAFELLVLFLKQGLRTPMHIKIGLVKMILHVKKYAYKFY